MYSSYKNNLKSNKEEREMKQCDNGHFYDEKRFDTCPYCQEGSQTSRTVSLDDIGKTVAVSN